MAERQGDMTNSETVQSIPAEQPHAPARVRPFNIIHLIVFFICWFPLNPVVVETLRNPNFSISFSVEALLGFLSMICGPFAPLLFYPNPELHAGLILVTGTTLLVSVLIQIFWRPKLKRYEVIRQLVWAIGCWIWFAGAFAAFAMLM